MALGKNLARIGWLVVAMLLIGFAGPAFAARSLQDDGSFDVAVTDTGNPSYFIPPAQPTQVEVGLIVLEVDIEREALYYIKTMILPLILIGYLISFIALIEAVAVQRINAAGRTDLAHRIDILHQKAFPIMMGAGLIFAYTFF